MEAYQKNVSEVLQELHSRDSGLNDSEVAERLRQYGRNKLKEKKPDSIVKIFLSQFRSPLIYMLLGAMAIVMWLGEYEDGLVILFVLTFNAIIGSIQEGRAQNTLASLKKFAETKATVVRNGKEIDVSDEEVVPGDILFFREGEKISADARLLSCSGLRVDESALTGESFPVVKMPEPIKKENAPVQDQTNIVFKGTYVTSGFGTAIVVGTGLKTHMGRISLALAETDTEIPLKKNIRDLSKLIIYAVGGVSVIIFILGLIREKPVKDMFLTVVSLAVSAIPEGLPIVLTIVLATGVWKMSRKHALVKKLQAVEALGQATVLAVDKTGTITRNEMVIKKIMIGGNIFDVAGSGYEPKGEIYLDGKQIDPLNHPDLLYAAKMAVFCTNAHTVFSEELKIWHIFGDPTEAALRVFADKVGFIKAELEKEEPEIFDMPFNYSTKFHLKIHKAGDKNILILVGAPESIIQLCKKYRINGEEKSLYAEKRIELEGLVASLSSNGSRVLAFASNNDSPQVVSPQDIPGLCFDGFYVMQDSLREEVLEAVNKTKSAGLKIVMITGDNLITGKAIAKQANIYSDGDKTLTGQTIDVLSDKDLVKALVGVTVFARVTPEHKLRIISAYRSRGDIVAMTGDGVNDAPSLVAADLGISMGKIGTEVAKEASDIVLLDDNLSSIISAVELGRGIYRTIQKVILYLFSTNMGEILVIAGALIIGLPLPVLPVQIIWLNLVTDGFLDVALATEPYDKDLLKSGRHRKAILTPLMFQRILIMSIPMMLGTLYIFNLYLGEGIDKARTAALTALAVFQWFNAWNCRSEKVSFFGANPFKSRILILSTLIIIFLQLLAVYNPFMQRVLHTVPLNIYDWFLILFIGSSIVIVEEVRKFLYYMFNYPTPVRTRKTAIT
jgi:Ca2+-transporting ATPase